MEIETTKLSKTTIETPNIKTNKLIAYDDILIRNSSLGKIFGNVEPSEEKIDARDLLSSDEETSSGAEQIQAFRCDISNYTYDRFKSITVRKAPGDNSIGATSQQKEVWMFVRCFDEYMNVVNDDNIISIDPVQQVSEETTWEFDPFILLPEYKILEFRITENRENLNTNPDSFTNTIRSANIHKGNTKLEIKNWKTINQAKVVENFATDCYFKLLRENTPFDGLMEGLNNAELNFNNHVRDHSIHLTDELIEDLTKIDTHINDNTVHVTEEILEDLSTFNNHINDDTVHVTEEILEDLTKIDTHINDNTIHVTQEEKDEWNNKLSTFDTHINDDTIHVTQEEKDEWNNKLSSSITHDISPNKNLIPSSEAVYNEIYNSEVILLDNYDSTLYGKSGDTVRNVILSKKHFTSGAIDQILIHHDNIGASLGNIQADGGYLAVQVLDENENQINIYYSDEKCEYVPSRGHYIFNFTNCDIPENYNKVHLSLVANKSTIPVIGSTTNELSFRIDCLTKNNSKDETIVFEEDDECEVRNGGWKANYVCCLTAKKISPFRKEYEQVKDVALNLSPHLEPIINSTIFNYNEIQELKSSTNEKFEKVKLETHDNVRIVEPKVYDNSPYSTGIKSAQGIAKVQICGQHMIEGKALIREAIIPQNTSASDEEYYRGRPLYLVIYGDTTGNDTFTFIGTSNNTQEQFKGESDMIFTFDDGINIGDYKKYRMFYATDISTTPSEPITSDELAAAPKMAFNALTLDINCVIWQSNGAMASTYTFPIKIKYDKIEGEDLLHKDNTSVHLNEEEKEMVQSLSSLYDHASNDVIHLSQEERDTLIIPEFEYSNVNENDELDNYKTHGFQLGNLHIKPGYIKEVRIPYNTRNVNLSEYAGTFYLAVQIFKNGDPDTESDNKSLSETYFSEDTYTISEAEESEYVFTFNKLEIPYDFQFVRFMLTTSNEVVPNGYSISNCARMRVRPVKRNGTDYREFDIDDCKLITGSNGSSQKYMAAAYFKYYPETKSITPQKILSCKWRLETGNINYETLDELCGALINTHNASIFVTSQKYNIYNFNIDNESGELDSNEKINFIIDIKYPNLMDMYDVIKTVHSDSYENEHFPKIYPIFV